MSADIDTNVPTMASRARLSDELGDNDIAGADAHKRTDAELSSQSFTGNVPDSSVPSAVSIALISIVYLTHTFGPWTECASVVLILFKILMALGLMIVCIPFDSTVVA